MLSVTPRARVGIDLDGVVFDFIQPFLDFVNERLGLEVVLSSFRGWQTLAETGQVSKEDEAVLFDLFRKQGRFLHLPVIPGFREVVYDWIREGDWVDLIEPIIISARHLGVFEDTRVSLFNIGFGDLPIELSTKVRTKAQIIRDQQINILIDDRLLFLQEVKALNPHCCTILFNWNGRLNYNASEQDSADYYCTDWTQIDVVVKEAWKTIFRSLWNADGTYKGGPGEDLPATE